MNKVWRDIPGYEGIYRISRCGLIVAYAKVRVGKLFSRQYKEKELSQGISNGYRLVTLVKNGVKTSLFVHRLVAMTFKSNDNFMNLVVNHRDFNPQNNHIDNLEWVTQLQNVRHSQINGRLRAPKGEKNGHSKIKDTDVPTIIKLNRSGVSQRDIAKKYKIDQSTVSDIITRKTYRHVGSC